MMIDPRTITTDIQSMIRAYLDNEKSKIDLNVSVSNNVMLESIEVLIQSKNYGCIRQISHYDLIDSRLKYIEIFALTIKPMVDEILSKEKGSLQVSTFNSGEELMIKSLKRSASKHAFNIVKKLNRFTDDKHTLDMNSIVIAGGCFASWFHDTELHDIDVFYLANYGTNFIAYNYIANIQKENPNTVKNHEHYIRNNKMIDKVYTEKETDTLFDYQHIFTKYYTRKALIESFDLAHATISYNIGEDKLYITRQAYDALKNKKLVRNDKVGVAEWRVQKFLDRGWTKDKDFDKQAGDFFDNTVNTPLGTFSSVTSSSYQSHMDKLLQRMAAQDLGS